MPQSLTYSVLLHLGVMILIGGPFFSQNLQTKSTPHAVYFTSLQGSLKGSLEPPSQRTLKEPSQQALNRTHPKTSLAKSVLSNTAETLNPADPLLHSIRDQIQNHLSYPLALRRKKVEGTVKIKMSLLSNGTLESAEITLSSLNSDLDELALLAVREAAPFQNIQIQFKEKRMDRLKLSLPIEFKIKI